MTGALTLEIQELTRPELTVLFRDLGHDLTLVWPGEGGGWTVDGRQDRQPETRQPVRGLLMPAPLRYVRAASDADLPVPAYLAYLPWDAPVNTPGWYLEHEGGHYHPVADARDPGGQGVVWIVPLAAPGQRSL